MDKLRHYKGVQFWTYTLDMTDRMYPVQQHSGVRSHLSRNVFEQISARLFLESFERGPFEQGAGSASDGTVVQRVDDAPAEIPAEEPAPSRPSSPPKNGLRHSLLHHHSLLHQNGLHHSLLKVRRRLRQSERSQRQRSPARSVGGPTGWRRSPYTRWLPVRAAHRRQGTPLRPFAPRSRPVEISATISTSRLAFRCWTLQSRISAGGLLRQSQFPILAKSTKRWCSTRLSAEPFFVSWLIQLPKLRNKSSNTPHGVCTLSWSLSSVTAPRSPLPRNPRRLGSSAPRTMA